LVGGGALVVGLQLEELDVLARAIRELPSENQREVVRLTSIGYGSDEIASVLGLSRVNVNQLRSRALRRLSLDPPLFGGSRPALRFK
jgi:DNA-directed RNA polymerase specialized sigma24 family protein